MLSMMHLVNKVAVVTGASSGIGRALAIELGLRGARVVIAARSAARLDETSALLGGLGIDHRAIVFDVTSRQSIDELIAQIHVAYPTIDILVNNAGIGLFETLLASSPEDTEAVFNTNLWGPLALIRAALPTMQNGLLVNISSAAAKYAPYRQGVYAASKAALERMTEAIGIEESSHMRTLLVIPDRTETPFMQNIVGPREGAKLALNLKAATPEAVARTIVRAIEKDKTICYTTPKSRVYSLLSAVFPGVVKRIIERTSR
jgi:serine 3-dehydrogenase